MKSRVTLLAALAAVAAFALSQTAFTAAGASADPQGSPSSAVSPAVSAAPVLATVAHRVAATPRPRRARGFLVARVRGPVTLRKRPRGRVAARIGPVSEFGSPQVLGVAAVRGRWLGVVSTAMPNGRLAWVERRNTSLRISRQPYSLHADISSRTITLRRRGRAIKRLRVAVGRPGSPTPTGRFAITDKLNGPGFGPYYGCCILALSAHQPHPPPGWQGGNRMAIHGTSAPGTIGTAASAGCLRAADRDLRVLMRRVPLGTPVFIRR
jgi:lipoprotein-anchoring transpeptidase ErfK/SrfK